MRIIICKDKAEAGRRAADEVEAVMLNKPDAVLGLATGSTPLPLYSELTGDCAAGRISFKKTKTFNLDEYVGLGKDHPQSYAFFMRKNLFDKTDMDMRNANIPDGTAEDVGAECARYSALLEKNAIDVQVLGIGGNGHIAFNEPGTSFDSLTRRVRLTEKTIADNSRFFDSPDEVPRFAISMGMREIFNAKKLLLIATGKSKAEAVRAMTQDPVSEKCPASMLRLHPDAVVILDEDAASGITV